jgi:predicted  nucleic acid-binding Zn-ribbon protein
MDLSKLTPEQLEIISKYKRIHDELSALERDMKKLNERSQVLIEELQQLRDYEQSLEK